MPAFGHGAHTPGQESGSAPKGSIYWLEGVLVSLVPDSAFEDGRDAAIAKAVEHGLADGKTRFQAILFSIQRFIMLDVCSQNGVKEVSHTKPIALVRMGWNDSNEWMPQSLRETMSAQYFDRLSQSTLERAPSGAEKEDVSPILHLRRQEAEFAALQTFFETAANRALETTSRGRLPPELYANVISKADGATHRACAKVSSITRDLSKGTFPFSPHLMVTNFQESSISATTDLGSTSRTNEASVYGYIYFLGLAHRADTESCVRRRIFGVKAAQCSAKVFKECVRQARIR